MFLSLWHYLHGYVIVEVSGANPERFLSLATYHGRVVWNVKRTEEKITFYTSIEDFKMMRRELKKTKTRIKIVKKKGYPFLAFRYKRRKAFIAGVGVFVALLWMLSSFVWLVDVEGNSKINSLDIIHTLEEGGYNVGKLKSSMDLREAETLLINKYPDIIWVGVDFEGTRMVVKVSESVNPPQMKELSQSPSSIVSKRDALVTYIAVEKGKPMVKKGDIVRKGDVLVSGEMPLGAEDESPYFTSAKAKIKGKTIYTLTKEMDYNKVEKNYTNKTSKKYILKLFDKKINLYKDKKDIGQCYDTLITLHQLKITKLFPLPFSLEEQTNVGYEPTYTKLTKQEVEDELLASLWTEISSSMTNGAVVVKREAYFNATKDKVVGTLYVVAEEELGYPVDIDPTQSQLKKEGESVNEQN